METTTLTEFQNRTLMTIPNYYKMMRVDQFLRETITKRKTNKQTPDLLDVSHSIINRYNKTVGITSKIKLVTRTPEENKLRCLSLWKQKLQIN